MICSDVGNAEGSNHVEVTHERRAAAGCVEGQLGVQK